MKQADKIAELEGKVKALTEENAALARRAERAAAQFEQEKVGELNRRLQNLEQVPETKYMNDVVERAYKAERALEDEHKRFQAILAEN